MFGSLLVLIVFIWLLAIFYIIKGWREPKEKKPPKTPKTPLVKKEFSKPTPKLEEEIEISISESPREETQPVTPTQLEDFYREFGKANIVEFPAEYIDKSNVKGLTGNKISILEFAKNCYQEIDFRCIDAVMVKEEGQRTYKVNIFDLIFDHYASTEEGFISYFGQLKERFAEEIDSISHHPDINPENKKSLLGRYEALPQLIVWNDRELLFVIVKSKDEILNNKEMEFLKEFVITKKLFKARIFKVTQRYEKAGVIKPPEEKIKAEAEKKLAEKRMSEEEARGKLEAELAAKKKLLEEELIIRKKLEEELATKKQEEEKKVVAAKEKIEKTGTKKRLAKKPFTKREIEFLKENIGQLSNEELAKRLGRSIDSVTHKVSRLGIARQSYEWTKEKDRFLRSNITKLSYRKLAEKLGTTAPSIRARCKKIKIKK